MLSELQKNFTALTAPQATAVSAALAASEVKGYKAPKKMTGAQVYNACNTAKLSDAALKKTLGADSSATAQAAYEKLFGEKPKAEDKPKRTRRTAREPDPRIIVAVAPNPKRGASRERFEIYKVGMTVYEAIALGMFRADIPWDTAPKRNLITLASPEDADAEKLRAAYLKAA